MNSCSIPAIPRGALASFFLLLLFSIAFQTAKAQRLPDSVIPTHYALTLTPDLKAAVYTGSETIDVVLKDPTRSITLNSIEIAFQSASITASGISQNASVALDASKQQATLVVPNLLAAGKATLTIAFTGMLNNQLRGFYLSKTAQRNYAVTQFEATDARRAFPCFDEPALKATYDISLVIDKSDTAISNSPIAQDTPGPGADRHTLTFLTTPRMSTYLVAFLVGDFQCTSGTQDGVIIRSCATPDKVALTPFSVDFAKFALHYFNTYFGIPYPLKKLDLIALPDFEAGAMENFGAITYRERALLIDEKTASIDAKKVVAVDIAHEMAHQWFGDLVTMQWWDNVWLNEGFATWMEYKAVAAAHPEWGFNEFVIANLDNTLNIDAQKTTRPIRARADTPDEIDEMFDSIAYGKAGDVLLMVENYAGQEAFRRGVHNYLAAHLYANATAEDFWNAEAAASHKPIDSIMDSFISQPGVPLLTFSSPVNGKVNLSQRRFFLSPGAENNSGQKWTLPVCFKAGAQGSQCAVVTPETTTLKAPEGSLFFANAGGKGYYRIAYPSSDYRNLLAHIESSLTPAERISFIGDQWAQLRANKASVSDYLDLVSAVRDDSSAQVLSSALDGVELLYIRVAATPSEKDALAQWIRATFAPAYKKLGAPSPSDSTNTLLLRARLFQLLGLYGKDPQVLAQARTLAQQFVADPNSVEPTLRQTALAVAAHNGDAALYNQFLHIYETSSNPEFQTGALHFLALFEDPSLLQRALQLALSNKVRNQDAAGQFAIALGVGANREATWQFIQAHWDELKAQFTVDTGADLVASVGVFCTPTARDDVKAFFTAHPLEASAPALHQSLEQIDGCIEFRNLQEPQLKAWIAARPH
ncbi:MAG TPA: M1 family metallopeptidase [Terracidiphilus sp.]|jgi:aminopeptidase N|nr:M1 family metallopeptidase [Terracidiphilus sp.]